MRTKKRKTEVFLLCRAYKTEAFAEIDFYVKMVCKWQQTSSACGLPSGGGGA